ncbi:orotate phosphoribosyltransferase [Wenzhouxiangella limi]|uniref:Orotate phosphoribosyltransferase n=1 Tax=Wenzhouxiangella limi TaxID=2707351 RepID=A0A845UVH3_9GAMM|nr:orotate phosphoribosyltransferase [Wenzhouxiangella limi]
MLAPWTRQFLELALEHRALRFGQFTLKSGRISPYFFNAGAFCDGRSLHLLAQCYADAIVASEIEFDVVFGPAYKGIPLAATVADQLYRSHGINPGFAYNRKEAKDHGEGGLTVGAPLRGRVLLVDDVISAGTAIAESLALIRSAGAQPVAVAVALDRQERGIDARSAVQTLRDDGLKIIHLASLNDLVAWLEDRDSDTGRLGQMIEYRRQFGA